VKKHISQTVFDSRVLAFSAHDFSRLRRSQVSFIFCKR
jgi:hypothetical protein